MVFTPTRGGAVRFGPGVPMVPDIGPGWVDAAVYTDPGRFERERRTVLRRSWQVICRLSNRECKITALHADVQDMLDDVGPR